MKLFHHPIHDSGRPRVILRIKAFHERPLLCIQENGLGIVGSLVLQLHQTDEIVGIFWCVYLIDFIDPPVEGPVVSRGVGDGDVVHIIDRYCVTTIDQVINAGVQIELRVVGIVTPVEVPLPVTRVAFPWAVVFSVPDDLNFLDCDLQVTFGVVPDVLRGTHHVPVGIPKACQMKKTKNAKEERKSA